MTDAKTINAPTTSFAARRRVNWIVLGLMYAAYYMCRYNMPIANKVLGDTFGWSKEQLGWVIAIAFWAYALGQITNGLLADRKGGRRVVLIGAVGTMILNVLMGFGESVGHLTYFIVIWGLNGYFQSCGAPSVVKVNASWFRVEERGTFSGIFGLMIQLGRWAITLLGGFLIIRYPWQVVFFVPAAVTAIFAVLAWLYVRDNPEDLGYESVVCETAGCDDETRPLSVRELLGKILASRVMWILSAAYFCTGVVRHGLDQWYIRYLAEVHHVGTASFGYVLTAFGLPIAAVGGSYLAGWMSDKVFASRRGPAAALMYFGQFVMLIIFTQVSGPLISPLLLIVVQVFVNGPHSLLGGAAAMDFGGRKGAGLASGFIDAWQYIGAGLVAGIGMGGILGRFGWSGWIVTLVGFALLGGIAMTTLWKARPVQGGGH